jgi:hypothetical protein
MPWMAAAVVGSSLIGASAASSAGKSQAAASKYAANLQQKQFEQTREDQMPWLEAGRGALNKLIPMSDYTKFGMDQFQADPGYAFRLSEGQKALDRSAAARGGLISGSALKAAGRFGQEMGSQEYQNAFNRYQTERASQLAPLQSLAGIGQTTASNLGATGAANAQAVGNYLTSGAAANAAGNVGAANAITGGLGSYMNYNSSNNLLNALQSRGGGGSVNYGSMYSPSGAGGGYTATGAENYMAPY